MCSGGTWKCCLLIAARENIHLQMGYIMKITIGSIVQQMIGDFTVKYYMDSSQLVYLSFLTNCLHHQFQKEHMIAGMGMCKSTTRSSPRTTRHKLVT